MTAHDDKDGTNAEQRLTAAGVFAGQNGLRGLWAAADFWERMPYSTRLYYGQGGYDYLHRDVLGAALRLLDQPIAPPLHERVPGETPRVDAEYDRIFNGDCLPGCDSYAHEEMCPITNDFGLMANFARQLERELAQAQADVAAKQAEIDRLTPIRAGIADSLGWALASLDLAKNGFKNRHLFIETDDPATCDTEIWNLNVAVGSINLAMKLAALPSPTQEPKEGK